MIKKNLIITALLLSISGQSLADNYTFRYPVYGYKVSEGSGEIEYTDEEKLETWIQFAIDNSLTHPENFSYIVWGGSNLTEIPNVPYPNDSPDAILLNNNNIQDFSGFNKIINFGSGGTINLSNNEEINAFTSMVSSSSLIEANNVNKISGFNNLEILNADLSFRNSFDVTGFSKLKTVSETIFGEDSDNVTTFNELESIKAINLTNASNVSGFNNTLLDAGEIFLRYSNNISGFNNENIIANNIYIENAVNISGFNNITTLNTNIYMSNARDISGFRNLASLEGKIIGNNMNNITGFNKLNSVSGDLILQDSYLGDYSILANLKEIGGNLVLSNIGLTSLDKLSNLEKVNQLVLEGNTLTDISGLENIIQATRIFFDEGLIFENKIPSSAWLCQPEQASVFAEQEQSEVCE